MFNYNNIIYVPLRKGEGIVTLANYQKTFSELGWKAKYNLQDYIKTIINEGRANIEVEVQEITKMILDE